MVCQQAFCTDVCAAQHSDVEYNSNATEATNVTDTLLVSHTVQEAVYLTYRLMWCGGGDYKSRRCCGGRLYIGTGFSAMTNFILSPPRKVKS